MSAMPLATHITTRELAEHEPILRDKMEAIEKRGGTGGSPNNPRMDLQHEDLDNHTPDKQIYILDKPDQETPRDKIGEQRGTQNTERSLDHVSAILPLA